MLMGMPIVLHATWPLEEFSNIVDLPPDQFQEGVTSAFDALLDSPCLYFLLEF